MKKSINIFGDENKEIHPIYVSKKCCEEKYVDLLRIGDEGKEHYDHTLHCGTFFVVIVHKLLVQKK